MYQIRPLLAEGGGVGHLGGFFATGWPAAESGLCRLPSSRACCIRLDQPAALLRGGCKTPDYNSSIEAIRITPLNHGKRLGIIGYGRIGQATARRGHFGFDMEIAHWNRRPKAEAETLKARFCRLDELLREADFLCSPYH